MMRVFIILAGIFLVAYAAVLSPLVSKIFQPVNKLTKKHTRFPFWMGLCAVIFVTGLYSFIVYNHSFPMAEGWYSLFSKYILSGKSPYKDFELLFTPGYSYLVAGFIKIFGYNIIALRIAGAVLFSCIACLLYLILTRVFAPWISVVGACSAAFYLQSEVAQIYYDYIRIYDCMNFLVCLFLIMWIQTELKSPDTNEKRSMLFAAISGFFAGCAILIRQSSGAIVLAYCLILCGFYLFLKGISRKGLRNLLAYFVCAAAPILLLFLALAAGNLLGTYLGMTGSDAIASKGGIASVLFAWIPRTIPIITRLWKEILFICGLLSVNIFIYWKKGKNTSLTDSDINIWFVFFTAALSVSVAVLYYSKRVSTFFCNLFYSDLTPYTLFVVGLIVFLAFGVLLIILKKKTAGSISEFNGSVFAISGFYIATAYGSATSSGLSEGQSAIIVGLLFALLLYYAQNLFAKEMVSLILALALCFSMASIGLKYNEPYCWWGLAEADIREQTETVNTPLMNGIWVSKERKTALEGIYNDIMSHVSAGDPIFVFPHIPIFYVMTDHYPQTFTLVQWFDVSSEKRVLEDIQTLKKNPPQVLVICKVPEAVIFEHEILFKDGKKSAQRRMMNALLRLAKEKHYDKVGEYDLSGDYFVTVYSLPRK